MKLIINNVEHDSTKELEIFKEDKFGFRCTIVYLPEAGWYKHGVKAFTYNNVTEFHHLYEPTRSAFESGIHSAGCSERLIDISPREEYFPQVDSIIIEDAHKVYDVFQESIKGD